MAGGSVTVAALRHRPRQAVLVVLLAAVVSASAALGPLYARAVEQSVLKNVLADAPVAQSSIAVSATGTATGTAPPSPQELASTVRGRTPAQFLPPIQGADTPVDLRAATGGTGAGRSAPNGPPAARGRLVSREGLCRHLQLAEGRCVRGEGELLVSRLTAGVTGVGVGDQLWVSAQASGPDDADTEAPGRAVAVVGVYEPPRPGDPFWSGRSEAGPAATQPARAGTDVPAVDDVLTTWPTVASVEWPALRTHLDIPVDEAAVEIDRLGALAGATKRVDAAARTVDGSAVSEIPALLASTASQRDQARTVIPLLAVQLAVLGVVVLAFVCAAATEQRRPEIALARLRGQGTRGAAGLLLRELGLLVLVGVALGAAVGWLVASAATALWLEDGVVLEARFPVALAVAGAAVAGLLAVVVAGAPTLRQPLTSLLRRVPPRASTLQVGLTEGAVVAAAAAGVVTLLSGESGPVALLAPGLLAIAGGLLLSQAVIPVAGPLTRRSLRRGRVAPALAGVQIARRPALRRLIAIVTVACALLVFAVDAWSVSDRNRTTRAAVEAGAPVVLTVDAGSSEVLHRALLDIDPEGGFATPVVTVRTATETGPRTTAVVPEAFARIATWAPGSEPTAAELAGLAPSLVDPIEIEGDTVAVTARLNARGLPPQRGAPAPELRPFSLSLTVVGDDGGPRQVELGRIREGTGTYRAALPCRDGCRLRRVTVNRTFGDFTDAYVETEVTGLRVGTGEATSPVDLDTSEADAWSVLPFQANLPPSGSVAVGDSLSFADESFGNAVSVQRGDVAAQPRALIAGDIPRTPQAPGVPSEEVVAPDLEAGDLAYRVVGELPLVPRSGPRGLLVDLAGVVTGPSAAPAQTTYDVWLATDDPQREGRLRDQLADHGIGVTGRDTAAAHRTAFADEGPTIALRLAVLAGFVSVVLASAVLVVGVATSGASRARDLAGLRVVGVPRRTVRRAAVREHLVVAVLGVVVGAALGVVSAQVALPHIPLFATKATRLPLLLDPVWPAVVATTAGCLVLLCAVSVVVGRLLAASATTDRLRESR
jgi:putative ABC transport system permease protein